MLGLWYRWADQRRIIALCAEKAISIGWYLQRPQSVWSRFIGSPCTSALRIPSARYQGMYGGVNESFTP